MDVRRESGPLESGGYGGCEGKMRVRDASSDSDVCKLEVEEATMHNAARELNGFFD